MPDANILMIGCGRMGAALATVWAKSNHLMVYDPLAELPAGAERVEQLTAARLPANLIVVLAIKPQVFPEIATSLRSLVRPSTAFVSIMAGVTIAGLRDVFGHNAPIIRAMPNTPAVIGAGMTAAMASPNVSHHV